MRPEATAEIRAELKKLGISSRQVSVRADRGSIDCFIKDVTIDPKVVRAIAGKHEHVRRCERSGDILEGGNTFVHVGYDWQAEKAVKETAEFQAVLAEVTELASRLTDRFGDKIQPGMTVFKHDNGIGALKVFFRQEGDDRYYADYYDARSFAWEVFIARKLNRKERQESDEVRA